MRSYFPVAFTFKSIMIGKEMPNPLQVGNPLNSESSMTEKHLTPTLCPQMTVLQIFALFMGHMGWFPHQRITVSHIIPAGEKVHVRNRNLV